LTERDWQILPVNTDRAKLPGFLTDWPETETYDVLDQAYSEKYADSTASEDDVRLMIVWIGNRLPYPVTDTDDEDAHEEDVAGKRSMVNKLERTNKPVPRTTL
jgi:hypothetical protein